MTLEVVGIKLDFIGPIRREGYEINGNSFSDLLFSTSNDIFWTTILLQLLGQTCCSLFSLVKNNRERKRKRENKKIKWVWERKLYKNCFTYIIYLFQPIWMYLLIGFFFFFLIEPFWYVFLLNFEQCKDIWSKQFSKQKGENTRRGGTSCFLFCLKCILNTSNPNNLCLP